MKNACSIAAIVLLSYVAICAADCLTLKEGEIMPNQADPNSYFICKDGMLELKRCSQGSVFDPVAKQCPIEPPSNNVNCTGYDDGAIFPIEGKCSGYVICVGGKGREGVCGGSLKYDPETGVCLNEVCED